MSFSNLCNQLLGSLSSDELVQLHQDLKDLPDAVCPDQDNAHYVITNGFAFLTSFHLDGRAHRYDFYTKGAILFDSENEANIVLALLYGLSSYHLEPSPSWRVEKLTKVVVRKKVNDPCISCPYEMHSAACWGNEDCPYNQ